MKKFIVLLIVLLASASAELLVNGVDLADIEEHYIKMEIKYAHKVKKYYAYVDYGQEGNYRDRVVINKNGEIREFNSDIKVLNTFYKNGWEIKLKNTYYKDLEIEYDILSPNEIEGGAFNHYTNYILERRAIKQ